MLKYIVLFKFRDPEACLPTVIEKAPRHGWKNSRNPLDGDRRGHLAQRRAQL